MTRGPITPWQETVVVVTLLAAVFLTVLHASGPVTTNDVFWHVKTGEHLWQTGTLPDRDVFSYTTTDLDWVLHEWLAQLAFFGLHELGGFYLLRGFTGAMALLILFLVYRFAKHHVKNPVAVAVVVLLFAILGTTRLQARPTLFSMALFVVLVSWFCSRRGPWGLRQGAILVGTILLWVNLHSVGLLGLVIYAAYLLGLVGRTMLSQADAASRRDLVAHGFTLVAAFAATSANPSGFHLYAFAFQDKGIVMNFITDEWGTFRLAYGDNPSLSPEAYGVILLILAALIATCFATGWKLNRTPKKCESTAFPDPVRLSMLLLCLGGGLLARRFHWLLALSLVLAIAHLRRPVFAGWHQVASLPPVRLAAVAFVGILLGLHYHRNLRYQGEPLHQHALTASYYTTAIAPSHDRAGVRFLAEAGLSGNAFAHYGTGGMVSYFCHPNIRVFIDSRVDLYRREVFLEFLRVRDGHPSQQQILDKYDTDIYYRHWETRPLREPSGWTKVFATPTEAIWLRKHPRNRENVARCKAWHRRHRESAAPPR